MPEKWRQARAIWEKSPIFGLRAPGAGTCYGALDACFEALALLAGRPPPPRLQCKPGEAICEGEIAKTCSDGFWEDDECNVPEQYCATSSCKANPSYVVGNAQLYDDEYYLEGGKMIAVKFEIGESVLLESFGVVAPKSVQDAGQYALYDDRLYSPEGTGQIYHFPGNLLTTSSPPGRWIDPEPVEQEIDPQFRVELEPGVYWLVYKGETIYTTPVVVKDRNGSLGDFLAWYIAPMPDFSGFPSQFPTESPFNGNPVARETPLEYGWYLVVRPIPPQD